MKNKIFHIIFVCLAVLAASGCATLQMRTADTFYDDLAFYNALQNYEEVAIKTQNPKAMLRTAECYGLLNFNKEAEQWYSLAMEKSKVLPRHQLEYAKVLMKNGNYELAKKYLNKYLLTDRNSISIRQLINSCDSLEYLFYNDTTMYKINLLEWNELTSSNFSPRTYKSGVMFVSDRDHLQRASGTSSFSGRNTYDIFFVKLTEFDNWLQPEPIMGEVNGKFNEGPFALNATQDTMYFTRNNYLGDQPVKNSNNVSTLKIYRAVLINAEWKIDGEVSVSSDEYSVAHPTISKDGNFMVFMSDMPWGYGGTDLYWSKKVNNRWTTPKNIGESINSSENEVYPYLQNDSVLYFSSAANYNMGGLDIFYSVFSNGSWSKPVNLGYPVNSSMDDFGFMINEEGSSGYFNSNREGADMIYSFTKGQAKIKVNITLTDSETKGKLRNLSVNLFAGNVKVNTKTSNNNGQVEFVLQPNKKYKISTGNNSFYYKEFAINTTGIRESNTKYYGMSLDQILFGQSIVNYEIKFNEKSSSFREGNEKALQDLADILLLNPTLRVELASHTNSIGSSTSNQSLSSQRAIAIKNYLASRGVSSGRVTTIGYGETRLVNHCKDGIVCLDEEHAENERIEFKVVGFIP